MGNSGCSFQCSQNPADQAQLTKLHLRLANYVSNSSLKTFWKKEFNACLHPPISEKESPGAKPVTGNGLDVFRYRY